MSATRWLYHVQRRLLGLGGVARGGSRLLVVPSTTSTSSAAFGLMVRDANAFPPPPPPLPSCFPQPVPGSLVAQVHVSAEGGSAPLCPTLNPYLPIKGVMGCKSGTLDRPTTGDPTNRMLPSPPCILICITLDICLGTATKARQRSTL